MSSSNRIAGSLSNPSRFGRDRGSRYRKRVTGRTRRSAADFVASEEPAAANALPVDRASAPDFAASEELAAESARPEEPASARVLLAIAEAAALVSL